MGDTAKIQCLKLDEGMAMTVLESILISLLQAGSPIILVDRKLADGMLYQPRECDIVLVWGSVL